MNATCKRGHSVFIHICTKYKRPIFTIDLNDTFVACQTKSKRKRRVSEVRRNGQSVQPDEIK